MTVIKAESALLNSTASDLSDCALLFVPSASPEACDMLNKLSSTEDNWNGRGGKAPYKPGLRWLAEQTTLLQILTGEHRFYSSQIAAPHIAPPYMSPSPDGGIEAMWRHGTLHVTLEIDLENRTGYYHAYDNKSEDWTEQDYNLESEQDIDNLIDKLSAIQN